MNEVLAKILEGRPLGATLWMTLQGTSMRPLFRSGDALHLVRCAPDDVRPGDIAVGLRPEGHLVAHLVGPEPHRRLMAFTGVPDPEGTRILARAVAVRLRSGVVLPVPRMTRHALMAAHVALRELRAQPVAKRAYQEARSVLFGRLTTRARARLLGDIDVRLLRPDDLRPLVLFVGDNLAFPGSFIQRQLEGRWQKEGAAVGAFDSRGRMRGFAFVDAYTEEGVQVPGVWVRALKVQDMAQGLGLGRRIVRALCEAAAARGALDVHADILESNEKSLKLFASEGFVDAPELTERFARATRPRPDGQRVLVVTRALNAQGPRS